MDHVKCNNCGRTSLVPTYSDVCRKCGYNGGLQWVDEDREERDPLEFDEQTATELLKGDHKE